MSTVFEYIRGNQIDVTNPSIWNVETFYKVGQILGKMHALSKLYKVSEIHRPEYTKENPNVFGILKNSWMWKYYEELLGELESLEIHSDTYGLVHHDFHQGNIIINENVEIVIIDFDECSYNWFAQDIAVFFYHAFWQQSSFNGDLDRFLPNFIYHFFGGYQSENLLHKDTTSQIPIFLKIREIYLYQLFNLKWEKSNLEDWQIYTIKDLEEKIKSKQPYAGIEDFSIYF